jgi:uncharacterized protein (TIGR02996 family)
MPEPIPLTDEYIYRIAPDGTSVKAAQGLVAKGAYSHLRMSADGTLLEARCKGSEPKPYSVRVRIDDPDSPKAGCNCMSMKHPCKHALGLLLLAIRSPDLFAQSEAASASGATQKKVLIWEATVRSASGQEKAPADVGGALLQAILAEPEDDGPRLIYADWLEENGQPERAEFIRVQFNLALTAEGDPRREAWLAREKKLWTAHRTKWLHPLPPHLRKRDIRFHKGFLEELAVNVSAWIKHCNKLFGHHPIYRLRLTGPVGRHSAGDLAVQPHLKHIRVLELAGCRFTEPSKTIPILFGTPFLTSLRRIDLSGCEFTSRDTAFLAASPVLEHVRELDLAANEIGPKGAQSLAESPRTANLRELSLANNPLGDAGARALAGSPHLQGLTGLDLRGVELGNAAKTALRERFGERLRLE